MKNEIPTYRDGIMGRGDISLTRYNGEIKKEKYMCE